MLEAGIVTPAADELATFYREGLGFEPDVRFDFPQGVVLRLRRHDARLKLFQPSGGARSSPPADPWHRDAGARYAALHVDDVDTVFAAATAAGASVLAAPTAHRPGARFALIADPEGNVWELLRESGS